jgi:exonuclease SbcC
MKPYLLRLQAFGPFASRQEICFDNVFDGGLFLIHGRTGAGKTSLLDGLCFALFGRPSTPEREKDLRALRSDLASADLLTETELVFSIGKEIYKVHRVPSQNVPKKRGEGTTELKASAELWRLHVPWPNDTEDRKDAIDQPGNWTPVAAKQEAVDREIEIVLGMNERQFRQIVILPQGKFREFLSSSSAERQTILERLFQTDRFSRFQTFLSHYHRQLEQQWRAQMDLIENRLKSFSIESVQSIPAEIQRKQSEHNQLQQALKQIQIQQQNQSILLSRLEASEQSQLRLHEIQIELKKLESQSSHMTKLKEMIQAHDRLVKYVAVRERFESLEKRLIDLERKAENCSNKIVEADQAIAGKTSEDDLLRKMIPSLDSLKMEHQRLRELYPAIKTLTSELKAKEVDHEAFSRSVSEAKYQVENAKKEFVTVEGDFPNLSSIHESLTQMDSETIKTNLIKIKSLELKYYQTQAANLAAELNPGESCPVCGSTDHPKPALIPQGTINKDELERERVNFSAISEKLRIDQERRISKLEQIQKYLSIDSKSKPDNGDLKKSPDALRLEFAQQSELILKKLEVSRVSLQENQTKLGTIEPRIGETRSRIEVIKSELNKISPDYQDLATISTKGAKLKAEIDQREALLDSIKRALVELEKQRAESAAVLRATEIDRRSAQDELALVEKQLDQELISAGFSLGPPTDLIATSSRDLYQKSVAEYEASMARIEGQHKEALDRFNEIQKEMVSLPKSTAEEARADLENLGNQLRSFEMQVAKIDVEINNLNRLFTEIKIQEEALQKMCVESDRTIRMNALITGDRSQNKLSVPLARFVLQSRFDDVLIQANRRLNKMTRGRYLLRRPTLSRNLSQSQGLNLSVEDAMTGKDRHADSLSGGESFMAALGLALGLSDVVQSNLGGVRLDSILVDEGFGTLDAESLDLALRTLVDLQAGGRMVGVISHVQEMRSQIDRRLEVIGGPDGSRLQWNHGAILQKS